MNFVFIYGPQGVGKLTVGTELARISGYKLWHSQFSNDAILPVFDWGSSSLPKLVHQIRRLVFEEAAAQSVDLITTFVYAHPVDVPLLDEYFELVEQHGGKVCPVQLLCESAVRDQRLQSESRHKLGKITSLDLARRLRERPQHDLFAALPDRASLSIDNTRLEPGAVARQIAEHYAIRID